VARQITWRLAVHEHKDRGASLMFRKKRIIWWETEPIVAGAEQARARGSLEDSGRCRTSTSPYYGPVTVVSDVDGGREIEVLDFAKR